MSYLDLGLLLVGLWLIAGAALWSMLIPDVGKKAFLNKLTGNSGGIDLTAAVVHLFTNNHTPVHGDVVAVPPTTGSYIEATWTGYAGQNLTGWAVAALDGSNRAISAEAQVTFQNTSAGSVTFYGYYVTDSTGATLLGAELLAGAPITLLANSNALLTITFTQTSEF